MLGLQIISWPRLIPWMLRAWSLFAFIVLFFVYFIFLWLFTDASAANKYYGAILQILGGAFVLFAIVENLNIFRSKTVWELVIEWFKDFPIRSTHNIYLESILPTTNFSVEITQSFPTAETLEDRIQNIEREIHHIKELQNKSIEKLSSKIEKLESEFRIYLEKTHSRVDKIDENLKKAMAGDVQSPIFGVLLAIIGTVISLFS